jgi:Flp pilus assembly protein TadG
MRGTIIKNETHGVLGRLLADQSGNVVAIMAAALIPLVGIVGGGVDMSRAYMTKARLQAACDAGSLAGRRAMTNLTYPTTAQDKANKMFNFNFKPSDYDATNVTFTTSVDSKGKVLGTATAKIPATLMKIFGKQNFELSTTCNADFQVPNIDTVLVLDVTGSMADCPDDSNCNSGPTSKIAGLKTAVRSFYDTLETAGLSNPSTQLRYGFVPYSQTTNGKDMFVQSPAAHQLPLSQLVDSWTYQSRVAEFTTPVTSGTAVAGSVTSSDVYFRSGIPNATTNTPISHFDCNEYSNNTAVHVDAGPSQGVYTPTPEGNPLYRANSSSPWSTTIPANGNYQQIDFSRNWTLSPDFNATSVGNNASTFKTCARIEKITDYTRGVPSYGFTKWIYKPVTYDVSTYKAGTTLNYIRDINSNATVPVSGTYTPVQLRAMADQSKFTQNSTTWDGCLEERSTVADATFSPIPSGAKDLDYLNLGTDDATKWHPILEELSYIRNGPAEQEQLNGDGTPSGVNQVDGTCPAATMRNLLEFSSTDINSFIGTLAAGGNTYHDIGMAWALRMISPNGMFAARNGLASNGGQISRNIIFMTDGVLVPNSGTYSSYGYERVDQRISGGNNTPDLTTRHARRFQALCDAARSQGIAVWTIAFGTSNPSNLVACADPGRAYVATNTAALTSQFQEIAKSIADLRLTQ